MKTSIVGLVLVFLLATDGIAAMFPGSTTIHKKIPKHNSPIVIIKSRDRESRQQDKADDIERLKQRTSDIEQVERQRKIDRQIAPSQIGGKTAPTTIGGRPIPRRYYDLPE